MRWSWFWFSGFSGEVEGVVLCGEEPVIGQDFDDGKEVGRAIDADFIDSRSGRDFPFGAASTDSLLGVGLEIDAAKDDWTAVVVESEVLPAVVYRTITTVIKEI